MPIRKLIETARLRERRPLGALAGLGLALFILGLGHAGAITTISQGYTTTDKVTLGSIVSLDNNSSDVVSATNTANVGGILGVVIDPGNSLLSLSSSKANQIQVATSGVIQTLVSNFNGNISQGDQITASPISGVGMKASVNAKVVGIAQADLNGNNGSNETYTDKNGGKHSVVIGDIPVLVNVSYFYKQPDKTVIPSAIQNVADSLAGRSVQSLPIIVSLGIFFVMLIIVASIIYSMIRSSIISVGRNPMSQSAIYRDLTQMSALVVGIIAAGIISIYMVLTKL